jgi:hypothetical protein
MYSTCIFCHSSLGSNDAIERFPVGRRLAFDASKGRLWVVCGRCQRWNLTPIEERWEAIEDCERRFRATTTRVSTGEIGLCQLREGLSLVRIGQPLKPEMASWRYGRHLTERWKQRIAMGVVGVPLSIFGIGLAHAIVPGSGVIAAVLSQIPAMHMMRFAFAEDPLRAWRTMFSLRLRLDRVGVPGIHRVWWQEAALGLGGLSGEPWHLSIQYWSVSGKLERLDVTGPEAFPLAGQVLAQINASGGNPLAVARAVERLEETGSSTELYRSLAMVVCMPRRRYPIISMDRDQRLALEMAANDDSERRAMEGELRELEERWRAAEEIAGIADNMLLPASVEEFFRKHGRRA